MKLMFDKLRTSDGKVKISFDNETTWAEYNIEDIKNTGIEFTEEDCPDLTKIRIAGAITKIGDIKTHISNGSFSQDLTADEKVESLNSRFIEFQKNLGKIARNTNQIYHQTNFNLTETLTDENGEPLYNEEIGEPILEDQGIIDPIINMKVYEASIPKLDNKIIFYHPYNPDDFTNWTQLEEKPFDAEYFINYTTLQNFINEDSHTIGEFIKRGYNNFFSKPKFTISSYTDEELTTIYNSYLESGNSYVPFSSMFNNCYDSLWETDSIMQNCTSILTDTPPSNYDGYADLSGNSFYNAVLTIMKIKNFWEKIDSWVANSTYQFAIRKTSMTDRQINLSSISPSNSGEFPFKLYINPDVNTYNINYNNGDESFYYDIIRCILKIIKLIINTYGENGKYSAIVDSLTRWVSSNDISSYLSYAKKTEFQIISDDTSYKIQVLADAEYTPTLEYFYIY